MPVHNGRDKNGSYYQWGSRGKKYYYTPGNKTSREKAKKLAIRQAVAISYSTGYVEI